MKEFFRYLFIYVFIGIFAVGVIGLLIPFEFEKFSYDNPIAQKGSSSYTYTVNFDIDNNSDKEYQNVIITINYTTKYGFSSYENKEVEVTYNLAKDDNKISFTHTSNISGSFYKINSVKLTLNNGKAFKIYSGIKVFSGINWLFSCLCIIGFFGAVINISIYLSKRKQHKFEEKDTMTFNERVRQAFTPIADTINTLKQTYNESKANIENNKDQKAKKITCPYCKGKYSSTEDKCPHCGAPPEPCD